VSGLIPRNAKETNLDIGVEIELVDAGDRGAEVRWRGEGGGLCVQNDDVALGRSVCVCEQAGGQRTDGDRCQTQGQDRRRL
jgi:hypothetical protein